MMIFLL